MLEENADAHSDRRWVCRRKSVREPETAVAVNRKSGIQTRPSRVLGAHALTNEKLQPHKAAVAWRSAGPTAISGGGWR